MAWLLLSIQQSGTFKPRWGSHSLLFGSYHFNKGVSRSNAKTSGLSAFRHWHQHSGPIDSEQLSLLFMFRACWYLCLSKAVYLHCSMCYLFLLYLIKCHVCSWLQVGVSICAKIWATVNHLFHICILIYCNHFTCGICSVLRKFQNESCKYMQSKIN